MSRRPAEDGARVPKLLIVRGNSGSGKSTVARRVRDELASQDQERKIALIEQDYLRRVVLREKESAGTDNVDLLRQTSLFALSRGYDVILEGILYSGRYRDVIEQLIGASRAFVFYLDVSLEETLRRHATKPNAADFGETEMREWYRTRDLLGVEGEVVLPETSSLSDSVSVILDSFGPT